MPLQQQFHRQQALLDPLGVIQAVHAHAQQRSRLQPEFTPHLSAAFLRTRRRIHPSHGPFQRDRVRANQRPVPPHDHRHVLAVDPRFHVPVHRIHEVVAVKLGVKAHDTAAQQAFQQLLAPRADPHPPGVRPRDVPEHNHRRRRQPLANHGRRQREMIVLHQDDRVVGIDFVAHRVGELLVHGAVVAPVVGAERRPRVRHVAQRPQPLVRKPVVVALLLIFVQPHAADVIRLLPGRHAHAIPPVHGFAIRAAAAVRHPDAGTRPHHRLQRGDQSACRMLDLDAAVRRTLVYVRLAVGQDDDLFAVQVEVQCLLQALRGPLPGSVVPLVGHAANQLAYVAEYRLELPPLLSPAPQHAAQFFAPAVARPFRHEHRHTERHHRKDAEGDQQKRLRLRLTAFDIAQIVQQYDES